jgi:hypothetical protein
LSLALINLLIISKNHNGKKKIERREIQKNVLTERNRRREERIHAQRKDQNSQEGVQIDHLLPIYIE